MTHRSSSYNFLHQNLLTDWTM